MENIIIKDSDLISGIRYVSFSMAKNDVREFCNLIHSNGDMIATTDGHRLHSYETIAIPAGQYKIVKNRKTVVELEPIVGIPRQTIMPVEAYSWIDPTKKAIEANNVGQFSSDPLDIDQYKIDSRAYDLILQIADTHKDYGLNGKYGFNIPYLQDFITCGLGKVFLDQDKLKLENGRYKSVLMAMRRG